MKHSASLKDWTSKGLHHSFFCFCLKIFVIPAMFAVFHIHQNSKALSASHQFIAEVYGISFILVFLISTLFHAVCLINKFR